MKLTDFQSNANLALLWAVFSTNEI